MRVSLLRLVVTAAWLTGGSAAAQEFDARRVPPTLEPWQDWATWGDLHADCPSPYNDVGVRLCFWPSRLSLQVDDAGGAWTLGVTAFEESWVPLPGDSETWPFDVEDDKEVAVVVAREGRPHVRLSAGKHLLSGSFRWRFMPQKVAIPREVGLVALEIEGQGVPLPNWDSNGDLWLRRTQQDETQDQLVRRVSRVLEDGAPLWLRTEVALGVSGKSREETLGVLLPEGWKLATIDGPIPVAVDDQGVMKAQVRAGQWTIAVDAYRTHDIATFRYAAGGNPIVGEELIGFRAAPQFRVAEIQGAESVDPSQTTFPDKWRELRLPVYKWPTDSEFKLVELQRGMGDEAPAGLTIDRELWLDQDGRAATYRDQVRCESFQQWRLDAAEGQELGAVRVSGASQLVTANPATSAAGVEIRDRRLSLEAVGRTAQVRDLPATGWRSDAESLRLGLNLPPGWRVLALFGADSVEGDWLTAWTLLDLFLLLVVATAVARMQNWRAGLLALAALGLTYHEPGAPRLTWLFLLAPLALLQVVKPGALRRFLVAWKCLALLLLALSLVPFLAGQVQSALYPQLEPHGIPYRQRSLFSWLGSLKAERPPDYHYHADDAAFLRDDVLEAIARAEASAPAAVRRGVEVRGSIGFEGRRFKQSAANMAQSSQTVIQTGPATPAWSWNHVLCTWNGPVAESQRVRPVLIPPGVHRLLTVARLTLLLLLGAILLDVKLPRRRRSVVVPLLFVVASWPGAAQAQFPDQQLLETLRQRLLETDEAFPNAAEIPLATLAVKGGRVTLTAEVHAAARVAVPLPGRFPSWSPASVKVDGAAEAVVRRQDEYLWVTLSKGVHQVEVEGLLSDAAEWQWTFLLKPRRVEIEAPGWTVSGLKPTGVPEDQVFFVRTQEPGPGEAAYDQRHYNAAVVVERQLEIGLVWKVHTTARRISQPGKAVALRVPLLAGERVLTPAVHVDEGHVNVRLGANQQECQWVSELPIAPQIELTASNVDDWVEQWRLMLSPVWTPSFSGLPPIFQKSGPALEPIWRPWPGESATLAFSRPTAVEGDTVTIHQVQHETSLGARLRTSTLRLEVESSLAGDFIIDLPPDAEIRSVTLAGAPIPVRRQDDRLAVAVKPGRQQVEAAWKLAASLGTVASVDAVSLPAESANVTSVLRPPLDRWVLWTGGPQQGPAVRFWTILVVAVLAGLALGQLPNSPMRRWEWVLLTLGLTQVHVAAALVVVIWLLVLAWRGRMDVRAVRACVFDTLQLLLVLLTLAALVVLLAVVREGLLGDPKMFIVGNGSTPTQLAWFAPRSDESLPQPYMVSVSVWWYRVLMLFWALWLAGSLVRWLKHGWRQFTHGVPWRRTCRRRTRAVSPAPTAP
ncbi:MAG: hypothetical protein KF847_19530 [Pirellulales bacterium]|nr:hypothetical protein [Pirellulales bacterium]